jgi:MFS family permease
MTKLVPVRTGHKDNEHGIPTYWSKSGRTLQKYITALATTDFLLFGYDQGVMAGIISAPAFVSDFPEVNNNSTWQGFVTSIYAVGCFLGASFILTFGDRLGRRYSIFLGAAIMIVGVIIQISSVPPGGGATAQFIIGRCITGVSRPSIMPMMSSMANGSRLVTESTHRLFRHIRLNALVLTTEAS